MNESNPVSPEHQSALRAETLMPQASQQPEQTGYVAGFMFDFESGHVALIRKSRPAWQRGKLNGIGGHIEHGETPIQAMVREFEEETRLITDPEEWSHYARLNGPEFSVDFFVAVGRLQELESPNEEQIEILDLNSIGLRDHSMIENLPWLIALAIDCYQDGRPRFAEITYPPSLSVKSDERLPAAENAGCSNTGTSGNNEAEGET